jgi:uncharacterized protein YqgV (UPF0045/DUF77 family)
VTEQALLNANTKIQALEQTNKHQAEELQELQQRESSALQDRIKEENEQKIQDLQNEFRERMRRELDKAEKRHQIQLKEIMTAIESGDVNYCMRVLNEQHELQLQAKKEELENQMKEIKTSAAHRLSTLIRHYENSIKGLH